MKSAIIIILMIMQIFLITEIKALHKASLAKSSEEIILAAYEIGRESIILEIVEN